MADILIVDDSPEILEAMEFILHELHGYEVKTATSERSMIEVLKNFTPDVILLDILLSGDNGREICKELKNNDTTKHIPVILMSASTKLLTNPEECGATDIIAKPFHMIEMTDKVKSVLKVLPFLLLNFQGFSNTISHICK